MTSDPAIWLSTHRALSHLASSYATFRIGTREGPSARRVLRAAEACLSGLPRGRASAQQDLVEPQATLPQEVCSLFGRSAGLPAAPSAAGMCSAEWSAGHFFQQWLPYFAPGAVAATPRGHKLSFLQRRHRGCPGSKAFQLLHSTRTLLLCLFTVVVATPVTRIPS